MAKNIPRSREFKTADIISMFGLVGVVATLSGVVLARSLDDDRPARTRITAEALSLQLSSQIKTQLAEASTSAPTTGGRGPASVVETPQVVDGELSKDAWGQPFHYHVGVSETGHRRVMVWSDGPNHKSESDESMRMHEGLTASADHGSSQPLFKGDDIGFVHED